MFTRIWGRFPIGLIFFSAGLKPRVCFRVVLVLPPGVCCFAEEDSKIVVELVALLSSIVAMLEETVFDCCVRLLEGSCLHTINLYERH